MPNYYTARARRERLATGLLVCLHSASGACFRADRQGRMFCRYGHVGCGRLEEYRNVSGIDDVSYSLDSDRFDYFVSNHLLEKENILGILYVYPAHSSS